MLAGATMEERLAGFVETRAAWGDLTPRHWAVDGERLHVAALSPIGRLVFTFELEAEEPRKLGGIPVALMASPPPGGS